MGTFYIDGQVEVSEGNAIEVAEFLANHTAEPSSDASQQVDAISDILTNIVEAGIGDEEVSAFFFQIPSWIDIPLCM